VAQRVAQDLSKAADPNTAVDAVEARKDAASLDTLKVGDEMTQATLNLLA
jgi:hypothetical protein